MMEQRTEEWFAARIGRVTASRVAEVVAKTKTGYGASRANYMAELICERLTGTKGESFVNSAMQHGIDTEPQARAAYEAQSGSLVGEVGFVLHTSISEAGASPDGFVDEDGLVEIKCPQTATHMDTLLSENVPAKYVTQMQWQMACTGRKWCDFVSYDPRLPEKMQLFVKRVPRDDAYIELLEKEVSMFIAEMIDKLEKLKEKYYGI
jgi:putative phage-type endonuclease